MTDKPTELPAGLDNLLRYVESRIQPMIHASPICWRCYGKGKYGSRTCSTCEGRGFVAPMERLERGQVDDRS